MVASSCEGITPTQHMRKDSPEDPWFGCGVHPERLVYGENNNTWHVQNLTARQGVNVAINSICTTGCLTCTSPSTNCQSCNTANNYYLSGSTCLLCDAGKYIPPTGDACLPCDTSLGYYMNGTTC